MPRRTSAKHRGYSLLILSTFCMDDQNPQTNAGSSTLTACVACRQRHLKCDATQPVCTRCSRSGQQCVYVASRRGQRPSRRFVDQRGGQHNSPTYSFVNETPSTPMRSEQSPSWTAPSHYAPSQQYTPPASNGSDNHSPEPVTAPARIQHNINQYYRFFHRCHPFLPPQRFANILTWPSYLRDAVAVIGSQYNESRTTFECGRHVDAELENCTDRTIEVVQTYLLRAIFMHASASARCARLQLEKGVALARELGLDGEMFAASQPNRTMAESARRTWWELFTIDALFAGFHHKAYFSTNQPMADTMLPCDESAYEIGSPPEPKLAYRDLRRRFISDDPAISSYALRLEAVGILGRVLAANAPAAGLPSEAHQALDGRLSTWTSTLPDTKSHPIRSDGSCDELLFQAHMIIHMADVYLQLPRSGIFSFRAATDVACAKANDQAFAFLSLDMHAARAMQAAKHLAALASLDMAGPAHTPFFTCGLVLVAIVHMSHMAIHLDGSPEWHMDRLGQVFGLLKSRARVWRLAANVHGQLKSIAARAEALDQQLGMEQFDAMISDIWWSDALCYNWPRQEPMHVPYVGVGGSCGDGI